MLTRDGIDRDRAVQAVRDPRFPAFTGLSYGLNPRESASIYRSFLQPASIARARRCWSAHRTALAAAETQFAVPGNVVTAILHLESDCGRSTGSHPILPRLARLAAANEPENVRRNIERHVAGAPHRPRAEVTRAVEERGLVLERMFYPEVLATFRIAERLKVDPLSLKGSIAGAFGMPQFLPTSFERFGVDGNDDGTISLYEPSDAIASCASYLAGNGWREGLSHAEKRRVLWSYNHSDAYVDTVLALAARLPG